MTNFAGSDGVAMRKMMGGIREIMSYKVARNAPGRVALRCCPKKEERMMKNMSVLLSLLFVICFVFVGTVYAEMVTVGWQNSNRMYVTDRSNVFALFEVRGSNLHMFFKFPIGVKTMKTIEVRCHSITSWKKRKQSILFIAKYIETQSFIDPSEMISQAGFSGCRMTSD